MEQEILQKEVKVCWGSGFLQELRQDLQLDFSDMAGFSYRNLRFIRKWAGCFPEVAAWQQLVAKLASIPWGNNLQIVSKTQRLAEAICYVQQTLAQGWSRNVQPAKSGPTCSIAKGRRRTTLTGPCLKPNEIWRDRHSNPLIMNNMPIFPAASLRLLLCMISTIRLDAVIRHYLEGLGYEA